MAGEWRNATLGQMVAIQRGHDLTEGDRRPGNVPVLGSAGENGRHDTAIAAGAGVVIGRSGASFGQVNYSETPYWPHNTVLYVTDFRDNEPRFVYYALKAIDFSRYNSGSAQQSLNRNHIYSVPVRIPGRDEQRRIANVLGTLDDKIELNRRMSETLEAMARALFKSWFVDFDPVRARAEGRDTGLPKHIADLFPESFEESQIGEIPTGWRVKPVGDLADVVGGSTPRTEHAEFWASGTHHWATPKDLAGLAVPVLLDTARKVTDAGLSQIGSGLLPAGTVLLSSRAPIGYLAVAQMPVAINQGFIAMKPKPGVSNLFLLRWAESAQDEILSRANGSTFLEISKASFRPIPIVAPGDAVMSMFDDLSRPWFQRMVGQERESRRLAQLRDSLLPKLVSGEIRVKASLPLTERLA